MTAILRVRAPATSANLGPGFDCAGAALDLWNELEISEGEGVEVEGEGAAEIDAGPEHLGLRAFRLVGASNGYRFRFVNRIPLARGLGSSAATIALGLVAATALRGGEPDDLDHLLSVGLELEGHPDNLAPALAGGVCLSWCDRDGRQRVERVSAGLPLSPIAVVPEVRVSTQEARAALPATITHADATFTASRAALLGAALAGGSAELLVEAFDDRLHEPYRGPLSPVFGPLRVELPPGGEAVTVSGSGPTVLVWARPQARESCAEHLRARFPEARVWPLAVSAHGAEATGV